MSIHIIFCLRKPEDIIAKLDEKNPKNNLGFTPLHFAAQNGHLELCKIVFKNIKKKNPRTSVGITPLYLAATNGHLNICEAILENIGKSIF